MRLPIKNLDWTMMTRHFFSIRTLLLASIALAASAAWAQVDPEWLKSWNQALENRPAEITSTGRIAAEQEPGTPMVVHGQVVTPDGFPASNVVVHGYHRDNAGFESGPKDDALGTWRLQGWVKTDAEGRFVFKTIRPAPDNLGREAGHIHFTVESAAHGRQWVRSVFFSDDPMVTAQQRRQSKRAGDYGRVREVRTENNVQHIDVKIRLKEKGDF